MAWSGNSLEEEKPMTAICPLRARDIPLIVEDLLVEADELSQACGSTTLVEELLEAARSLRSGSLVEQLPISYEEC